MSNLYNVGFYYTEYSKVQISANSQEEAERMVYQMLEDNGMLDFEYDPEVTDREYDVAYSEVCDG